MREIAPDVEDNHLFELEAHVKKLEEEQTKTESQDQMQSVDSEFNPNKDRNDSQDAYEDIQYV